MLFLTPTIRKNNVRNPGIMSLTSLFIEQISRDRQDFAAASSTIGRDDHALFIDFSYTLFFTHSLQYVRCIHFSKSFLCIRLFLYT